MARADLPQRLGWPQQMSPGISGQFLLAPMEGVAFADVNGDSRLEVVGSSGDRVWVWDLDGKVVSGWPQTVQGTAQMPAAVGDVDGDGDVELVQVARGLKYSDAAYLHVFHHDGTALTGWPVSIPNLVFHTVTLADLDGDGGLDLVVQIGKWPPAGSITVLSRDGKALGAGWIDQALDGVPMSAAAVGDVTGDGQLEVAHLTSGSLTLRRAPGDVVDGFPLKPQSGREWAGGVALADLGGASSGLDIIACDEDASGNVRVVAFTAGGQALAGFPAVVGSGASAGVPSVGDLDGDGKLEIVVALAGQGLVVVSADGTVGQTIATLADSTASVQLVDLDGDGKLELLADNNSADPADGRGYLEAYRADGTAVPGFPLRPPGSTMKNAGAAADLDGDGILELAVVTTDSTKSPPESWVSLWSVPGSKAQVAAWPLFGHDGRRSGCAGSCASKSGKPWSADAGPDTGPDIGLPDAGLDLGADGAKVGDGDGCGCALDRRPRGAAPVALLLLVALGLAQVRRRSRRP